MYSLESELGGVSAKSLATQCRDKIENFVPTLQLVRGILLAIRKKKVWKNSRQLKTMRITRKNINIRYF